MYCFLQIMYSRQNFKKLHKMLAQFLYQSNQEYVRQQNVQLEGFAHLSKSLKLFTPFSMN